MKKIVISGLVAGIIVSIASYGGMFLAVRFLPQLFIESYANNPLISSGGIKDLLFFTHAFILSFALAWLWDRFKNLLRGAWPFKVVEFAAIYALVGLLPIMWITYSAMDVTITMVFSWFLYGFMQANVAGIVFSRLNP